MNAYRNAYHNLQLTELNHKVQLKWYIKKIVNEISINLPELFITGKYVKIKFKNGVTVLLQRVLEVKRSKMLQKIEELSLFTFLVSFFMGVLVQKLIYPINKWLNFVFGSCFEQDHLNIIILGVHAKRWPKCARISKQKLK